MTTQTFALIATKARNELLVQRAIPAVLRQTLVPDVIVVVEDGRALDAESLTNLRRQIEPSGVELAVLRNGRAAGAGGSWNTGLEYLLGRNRKGFVAILDDDDEWDRDHIESNCEVANGATIVVSGLRMVVGNCVLERPLIDNLAPEAFLAGNPGWQGSNTFVSLDLLIGAGGFREGLQSLNDRDLAIRLLRHPLAVWRLTNKWTSTWYSDTIGNLSTPQSFAKREGLRSFWQLYSHEMNCDTKSHFLSRAWKLFGITENEIVGGNVGPLPALGFPLES